MLVPKFAACMIHLFHSNEVKFNFLKKLFGCLCIDLDPETECCNTSLAFGEFWFWSSSSDDLDQLANLHSDTLRDLVPLS